jgi:hypothetical protein
LVWRLEGGVGGGETGSLVFEGGGEKEDEGEELWGRNVRLREGEGKGGEEEREKLERKDLKL